MPQHRVGRDLTPEPVPVMKVQLVSVWYERLASTVYRAYRISAPWLYTTKILTGRVPRWIDPEQGQTPGPDIQSTGTAFRVPGVYSPSNMNRLPQTRVLYQCYGQKGCMLISSPKDLGSRGSASICQVHNERSAWELVTCPTMFPVH